MIKASKRLEELLRGRLLAKFYQRIKIINRIKRALLVLDKVMI